MMPKSARARLARRCKGPSDEASWNADERASAPSADLIR